MRHYRKFVADLTSGVRRTEDWCRIESIGISGGGRDIPLLHFRSSAPTAEALWLDATIHGHESICDFFGAKLVTHLAHVYGHQPTTKPIRDVYFVPRINVDGAEYTAYGIPCRTSPLDLPESVQGWLTHDADGDGWIGQIRVDNPGGEWHYCDVVGTMVYALPGRGSNGRRFTLLPEGSLIGNVAIGRPAHIPGTDVNRNFAVGWHPSSTSGPAPFSAVESNSIAKALSERSDIGLALHFHGSGGGVLCPNVTGLVDEELLQSTFQIADWFAAVTASEVYAPWIDGRTWPSAPSEPSGMQHEWVAVTLGVPSLLIELYSCWRTVGMPLNANRWLVHSAMDEVQLRSVNAKTARLDNLYRPWQPSTHPQLGAVEIGGWLLNGSLRTPFGPAADEVYSRYLLAVTKLITGESRTDLTADRLPLRSEMGSPGMLYGLDHRWPSAEEGQPQHCYYC